ncbi:MAG TPA: M14 metallopeptidase family protein [Vicinamibacteria bacterium]|nr:M14 metallopeptidase family protein [Vicinamibacteria bacterium]
MKTRALALAALALSAAAEAATARSPSEFLGIEVGADRTVADYRQILAYFKALDAASPRVEVEILGKTTLGEDLFLAAISSEANLASKKRLQEIARRIADPRGLADAEAEALVRDGKVFLFVTCNIHSTEIGASQMAMEWAHALATAEDADTKRRLDEVVLLLLPSINPDGQLMETEWYRKNLGTRYEGGRMPWLYHHYVGHDNNRDWFMLTQKETQAVSRAVYHEWLPQVWLDEHQMGATGPRIFVPPYSEPVDPDIHPLVWRDVNLIGANMAFRLEQAHRSGVIYGYAFDAYWPGGTKNTAWWKNVSGLLTEVASARFATPVRVEPNELSGGGKGLVEYGPQTNFPNPWPGGTWRLRDIMDYERIVSDAILETCAERRADFLKNALARARAATSTYGPTDAFRIPAGQRDAAGAARLAALLAEHGVELQAAANGDVYVPLAQPYGRFVSELLTPQRYPETKLVPGKDIVRPYDVSAWTLPLMMGVTAERTTLPAGLAPWQAAPPSLPVDGAAFAIAPGSPETARLVNAGLRGGAARIARAAVSAAAREWPAGTVFLDVPAAKAAATKAVPGQSWAPVGAVPPAADPLRAPRVGLYKPWAASMDEGWTRFVLDQYGFDPKTLDNKTVRAGGLSAVFDAVVLPDLTKEVIATGKPKRDEGAMRYSPEMPPEYSGGLEKEGAAALKDFVEKGGTLVALASSTEYAIEELALPVRNGLARPSDFAIAGSLLQAQVVPDHPVTYGLPAGVAVFQDDALAFDTVPPGPEIERRVLATYPAAPQDVLLSGWMRGPEAIARKAAAVALTCGKGKVVLLGFRAQHRAQTPGTFPFLFNALYWSAAAPR